jgi:hypothetical protein
VIKVISWVFTVLSLILSAIFTVNIKKLLEVKGWDKFLLEYWPDLIHLVQSRWIFVALIFSGGVAAALWVVRLWPEKILEIIKAEYGTEKEREDVTGKLIKLIKNNKLEIIVSNEILGVHPDPGIRKSLYIKYKFNGEIIEYKCRERDRVVIP